MTRKRVKVLENIEQANEQKDLKPTEIRTIITIFREIQDSDSHERLLIQLKIEFYDKLDIEEFSEDFFECMRQIIVYQDRLKTEIPLAFCIKFVISCLSKSDTEHLMLKSNKLLKRLTKFAAEQSVSTDALVRLHCVQIARLLLTELTDDLPVPETIYTKIQDFLLARFMDVKSYVRSEAATASTRLQDPNNAHCQVVAALSHLSKYDSSHTARLAAMQSLAITTQTLQCIIDRVRDVNDVVRKKAFDILTKWKILKPLSISVRLTIVEAGLTDKSDAVRGSCKALLKAWLVASDNDMEALLRRLDVENAERETECAMRGLLGSLEKSDVVLALDRLVATMDNGHLVKEDLLGAEMAFLWRHLVTYVFEHSDEYEGQLDRILPSVMDFEKYLRRLFQKPIEQSTQKEISIDEYAEYCTIIKHLLAIVNYIDVDDTFNRNIISNLIKWAMSSVDIPFNYVEHLMKLLVHLESNNLKICDQTVELINELLYYDSEAQTTPVNDENKDPSQGIVTCPKEPILDIIATSDVNKEALRKKKIEIVEVDVKINELKEVINIAIQDNNLDGITELVSELKELESHKKELIELKNALVNPADITTEEEVHDENVTTEEQMKGEVQELPPWMADGMESRIIKANIMAITMIQECRVLWTMPPSLRSLVNNVILISIRHNDTCVREKAILALGLCCLLDKELAVQYYTIFLKSLEIDHDQIKLVAVNSLVDLFIRFGIEPFHEVHQTSQHNISVDSAQPKVEKEEPNKSVSDLINPIVVLLNENIELQTAASIGLSKLFYHHKIFSARLLSRLLIMWFNPDLAANSQLKAHLGGFFTNYALMSLENQQSMASCFTMTTQTVMKAPASSPLSDIEINNVVDFFLRVTDSKYLLESRIANTSDIRPSQKDLANLANPCHDHLGKVLANEILMSPVLQDVRHYIYMLVRLRFSPNNMQVLTDIEAIMPAIIDKLRDRKSIQLLTKFHTALQMRLNENKEVDGETTVVLPPTLLDGTLVNTGEERSTGSTTSEDRQLTSDTDIVKEEVVELLQTISVTKRSRPGTKETVFSSILEPKETTDENVFKKPMDVRVTRSSSHVVLSTPPTDVKKARTKVTKRSSTKEK